MKKITAIAWIITILMIMVASPAFATDWGSENVTMHVGETKTLYLPSSITSKTLKSVNFYSASYNVVEVVSHTNYSVKVKALKATSTPVIVRCDYYYYINNGGYTYQNGGAYDFKVTVEGEPTIKPSKITLPSNIVLEVGESQDIVPTVIPSNAEYTLTWSISDASIATIYNNGMITGKSVGYADLKVKADNGVYAMSRVSVYQPTPSSISIKSSLSMSVGDTYTLSPTVYPTNSQYTLTWTSSDTGVATVSSSGKVTAKSIGNANITVMTNNGKSATCSVAVSAKEVTSVSIKSSLSLEVGDSYTLTPAVTPSDAETSYTWSSDNSGVATVSQYGVVTAKSAGTANITVKTANGKSATCRVIVNTTAATEYEVHFSIYGYEHGQVLYNGVKLVGDVLSCYGNFKVTGGSDVVLSILPDEGYKIDWLWVDWDDVSDQLENNVLTIHNIRKDIDVVVSFEEDQPVVIVPIYLYCNVGEGGYITTGNTTIMGENKIGVGEGDDITVKIVANAGYHIDVVELDGVNVKSQLIGNELTVKNLVEDKNLIVRFGKDYQEPDEPVVSTENALTLGNVIANTGNTVSYPVSLTNKDEITALQMDLHLPAGMSLATNEEGDVIIETSNRVSNRHSVDCNKMTDGSYRIICYSTKNVTFTGNSGELFSVMLNIDANVEDGVYEIKATNVELSDKVGIAYSGQDVKGTVSVRSYTMGDTDNNGKHTINDAVCIINYILNQSNVTFIEAAADLDGNGKITVNDAVLLISQYILGNPSNARQTSRAAVNNGENYLSIEDIRMRPGEVKTIEILMINDRDDIKGMQCDITLPQGISFLYDEDAEDFVSPTSRIPKKLTLSSEKQNDNTLRVAGVCTGSSSIYGNSGSVFTLRVKADDNIMLGMYQIQLSNVELSYGEAISASDRLSALEIVDNTSGMTMSAIKKQEQAAIYDLKGQRVDASKAKNGIYIINGKKKYIK